MAIHYIENNRIFMLHTAHSTYEMQADRYGYLLHLYYGARIQGTAEGILTYTDRGFSGNPYDTGMDKTYSLDSLPLEYAFKGSADYRTPAFSMRSADGTTGCDLRYVSHEIRSGKYDLPALPTAYDAGDTAQTLEIVLEDAVSGIRVRLLYGVFEDADVITRAAIIENHGVTPIILHKVSSLCLDYVYGDYKMLTFYGRHAMERNLEETLLCHGMYSIGSSRGASGHFYNPFAVLAEQTATEDAGACVGMHLVYSGNFLLEAESDGYNQLRVVMGIGTEDFAWNLEPGQSFEAPEALLTFSESGYATLTNRIHRFFRSHILRGPWIHKQRPVLINNWEATYFDFDGDKIEAIAAKAADLGIDLMVLDDGWFGKREADVSGLGDWVVNTAKLKGTMGELAERVTSHDMQFGLWFEPEMVSEDSDLYRAHPDWAFTIPGRRPTRSRYQLVLDFSRQEVVDEIYHQMCEVLDHANISYIKWDMNRNINDIYSAVLPADRQGEIAHRYILGVYRLLRLLLDRYPDLLIEGCAGGGGRFDAGMLCYEPQIWCSDNTDAIDRCRIQYGTSFGYPTSTMGAHVSAAPNHQTGRMTPFYTRGVVAMAGTFGYELDLGKVSAEEQELVRDQLATFRRDYEITHEGDYYRLADPYDTRHELSAWMHVYEDRAVVSAVSLSSHGNCLMRYLRLKGLDPEAVYEIEERGREYTGSVLMNVGIALTELEGRPEYSAVMFHLARVE